VGNIDPHGPGNMPACQANVFQQGAKRFQQACVDAGSDSGSDSDAVLRVAAGSRPRGIGKRSIR
jgi:hypothetical protein